MADVESPGDHVERIRPESGLTKEDLIPDAEVASADDDDLEHDAVASVLTDLVVNVETSANIALFGPWGSGKSSLFGMVDSRLKERAKDRTASPRIRFLRYDAWKFGGPGLHRNFLAHVVDEVDLPPRDVASITGATESTRLLLGRFLWRNKLSLAGGTILAVMLATAWTVISAWVRNRYGVGSPEPKDFGDALVAALPSGGVAFALVMGGLLLSNQVMSSAVEKRTQSPLQDADQFFAVFDRLMEKVTRRRWFFRGTFGLSDRRTDRLVVFVDELDRCRPQDVASSLTDLMTFLGHEKCVFIVAADREVLEEALDDAPQAKPVRESEPYYSTSGVFLDKVFKHQVSLPPTRSEALTVYARTAADRREGFWKELRDADQQDYFDVMYALVPTHVRSPRRVKVLMNNFATNVRLLNARGLPWRNRAVQVAVMTVLQTEFPSVVRDLLQQPRLLDCLVGSAEASTTELEDLVARYDPESDNSDSPVPVLSDDDDRTQAERLARLERATRRLKEQLHAYLGKIKSAEIGMPGADLVYVQSAAHAEGLEDEELARLLDVAADTAPTAVAERFETATLSDQAAAVRFLVNQLGSNFGQSRSNLVESACRIAMLLDDETARNVARGAAGHVVHETRGGRWRAGATVGAVRLALLDSGIAAPLEPLRRTPELDNLAENGGLKSLLPLMSSFGTRADELFDLFGAAYSDHPELLHEALEKLPADLALRLWLARRAAVEDWFTEHAVEPPAPPVSTTPADRRAAAAEPSEKPEPSDAAERYAALIESVTNRDEGHVSEVVTGVAALGIDDGRYVGLASVLVDHFDTVGDAVTDPLARAQTGLDAIARTSDTEAIARWATWLEVDASPDSLMSLRACQRLATNLAGEEPEHESALQRALELAAGWLSSSDAEDVAKIAHDALIASPPDGTEERRALRSRLRAVLAVLEATHADPGYVHGYFLKSHVEALRGGQVTAAGVDDLIAEVRLLPDEKAEHVAMWAAKKVAGNDPLSVVRLRIDVEGQVAKRLPIAELLTVLPAPGSTVVREWAATNPPMAGFLELVKKDDVTPGELSTYAPHRTSIERARLWILLERRGASIEQLRAVGLHGVGLAVVAHMKPKIVGVSLAGQTEATTRLATADLSRKTEVKSAANDLVLALLDSGVSGAGPNAAHILFASGGAAPGRKPEIRAAVNTFVADKPNTPITKADKARLIRMKLLSESIPKSIVKSLAKAAKDVKDALTPR